MSMRILVIALVVSGCGSNSSRDLLEAAKAAPGDIVAKHSILVATTRARAEEPREFYGGGRALALGFARVDVTIPAKHKQGALERPGNGERRDAAKHFAASELAIYTEQQHFRAALKERLAKTGGRALVFVHGYRTPFDGSVYRAAQIVHDSGFEGTPVLFSWASTGRTVDYIYDNNSATVARDGLEETLRLVAEAGARRIDIVAHSMGNWIAMEALRQLTIAGDRNISGKLGDVVLAAPDIDVDVFKSQLRRIGRVDRPFFVLTSRDDRALRLSGIIAGNRPRVGDYDKDTELASLGITVVDLSGISSGDSLNHAKFADNPLMVQLLGARLNEGDEFGHDGDQLTRRIERLTSGLGQTLGSAAEIIITTPLEVINIAVSR